MQKKLRAIKADVRFDVTVLGVKIPYKKDPNVQKKFVSFLTRGEIIGLINVGAHSDAGWGGMEGNGVEWGGMGRNEAE